MVIEIKTLAELDKGIEQFIPLLKEHNIFAFHAEMGSGKTTFISRLIQKMGYSDDVSSPTFSIINEYETSDYGICYHLDLYRIESDEEAYDIGIEEILYGKNVVFLEWPSKIENLLPENTVIVRIEVENNIRKLIIDGY
jgi:tRNA threonylcarbamoyladenosine biosynthesis protein TsaE